MGVPNETTAMGDGLVIPLLLTVHIYNPSLGPSTRTLGASCDAPSFLQTLPGVASPIIAHLSWLKQSLLVNHGNRGGQIWSWSLLGIHR